MVFWFSIQRLKNKAVTWGKWDGYKFQTGSETVSEKKVYFSPQLNTSQIKTTPLTSGRAVKTKSTKGKLDSSRMQQNSCGSGEEKTGPEKYYEVTGAL